MYNFKLYNFKLTRNNFKLKNSYNLYNLVQLFEFVSGLLLFSKKGTGT